MYSRYTDYIRTAIKSNNLTNFKNHPSYTYMLEHVNQEQGTEYLKLIKSSTDISHDEIVSYCNLNDSIGNPTKVICGEINTSPTSLRYVWQAHLILEWFRTHSEDSYDIIELGGGYGGLCLAIYFFSKKYGIIINSYTIVDLKDPIQLQRLYLNNHQDTIEQNSLKFVDSSEFGKDIIGNNFYLVSNYCFSEIDKSLQKQYITNLFGKVIHGFMAWNNIDVYDFGFETKITEETPKTGKYNKFVYF